VEGLTVAKRPALHPYGLTGVPSAALDSERFTRRRTTGPRGRPIGRRVAGPSRVVTGLVGLGLSHQAF